MPERVEPLSAEELARGWVANDPGTFIDRLLVTIDARDARIAELEAALSGMDDVVQQYAGTVIEQGQRIAELEEEVARLNAPAAARVAMWIRDRL